MSAISRGKGCIEILGKHRVEKAGSSRSDGAVSMREYPIPEVGVHSLKGIKP
jgi:hypothetical protein